MKRFIGVLAFWLLFFAGKADTIGAYTVMHKGKVITSATEFDTIQIKLRKKEFTAADTLLVDYWSCGSRSALRHQVRVKDSTTDSIVLSAGVFHTQYYLLPLNELLLYEQAHPGTVFDGSFITKEREYKHRIYFRLEFTE